MLNPFRILDSAVLMAALILSGSKLDILGKTCPSYGAFEEQSVAFEKHTTTVQAEYHIYACLLFLTPFEFLLNQSSIYM